MVDATSAFVRQLFDLLGWQIEQPSVAPRAVEGLGDESQRALELPAAILISPTKVVSMGSWYSRSARLCRSQRLFGKLQPLFKRCRQRRCTSRQALKYHLKHESKV